LPRRDRKHEFRHEENNQCRQCHDDPLKKTPS
jgi:hypothetical protein